MAVKERAKKLFHRFMVQSSDKFEKLNFFQEFFGGISRTQTAIKRQQQSKKIKQQLLYDLWDENLYERKKMAEKIDIL